LKSQLKDNLIKLQVLSFSVWCAH